MSPPYRHTDKKENQIFLIYNKSESAGLVAESYMRMGLLIHEEMSKYFTIYEGAVSHIMTWQLLHSEENFLFFFISAAVFIGFLQQNVCPAVKKS